MKKSIEISINDKIKSGEKLLAVLIDPDSTDLQKLENICNLCNTNQVDLILVGGSLITNGFWDKCIKTIKSLTKIPLVLFPGNILQVHPDADAILFLSMISGRNADLLIGKHVLAAPGLKESGIEIIPTGYMIIDGGNITSVMYMSNTTPIPHDKSSIAACTAMAGEMLGLRVIYMDAGSGAKNPISAEMIKEVRANVKAPIFIGGGIKTVSEALQAWQAGADVVVVGNAIESEPNFIKTLSEARKV
ncbi:MAG: geranylgeranylglyceryl/heptaprenylglyceryl phosphate synthase [Bacteroidia bacterium]